ncbi:hemagglutinin protein [Xanthomarina sp. F2636L]|uniref:hemagglutinin protein n=1 Tax=Xanthomarina sp. F2636L TaxID=2996018 RepID=UPI00225E1249|nr:hemagglutinin protein [Xanthomarina sp. F2636L]MCX7550475.1 hemagglutinin protein [Xanthomarina sp. F2636L]
MKAKLTFLSVLLISFISHAQTIEKFSIDSGGASAIAGGIEILYTIGEVNVQELSAGNIQVSEGFINGAMKIKVDPKLFLQGPLLNPVSAGLMNDDLRSGSYIPTTSPYADAATCDASVFNVTGSNAIVDWVWIELRAANDNTKLVNGKSALLQRDGDVVGVDGVSDVIMTAGPTNYYVVVKHRNHLGAMSASTIALNETTATSVDFTNSGFSTHGSHAQVVLGSGSTALWAGNTNADDRIRYQGSSNDPNYIKDFVLTHPGNPSGNNLYFYYDYDDADVDMDGRVRFQGSGNDSNLIKDIVLSHPENGSLNNLFFILTQVPNN